MQIGKILARGQITLPRNVRRAAGLEPGDVVAFEVTSPGHVELRALPRLRLAETFRRYRIDVAINDSVDREQWQDGAAADVLGG